MVDDGGRVLLQLRHPRATIASGDSPFAKARTAVRLDTDPGRRVDLTTQSRFGPIAQRSRRAAPGARS